MGLLAVQPPLWGQDRGTGGWDEGRILARELGNEGPGKGLWEKNGGGWGEHQVCQEMDLYSWIKQFGLLSLCAACIRVGGSYGRGGRVRCLCSKPGSSCLALNP